MPLGGIYFLHDFRVACKGEARFHISQPLGYACDGRITRTRLLWFGSRQRDT